MEISLQSTPFLQHEVALALGLSVDDVQRYFDAGLCDRSAQLVSGFADVLCFPNFFDVVRLGVIHSLKGSNRLSMETGTIGDEVTDALSDFLDCFAHPDPLGRACRRQFYAFMKTWAEAGVFETYCMLEKQDRRKVILSVLSVCYRIRRHILRNRLTHAGFGKSRTSISVIPGHAFR